MRLKLQNDTFIRALLREKTHYTPVWLMRQAGRYLPEYLQVRARAGDFMSLCQSPELACEVTLQPLRRFNLDAAILFSDILTIPHAMGLGLHFEEGEGPIIDSPIRDNRAILQLPTPDPESELRYVMDSIRLIKEELNGKLPLIGFAGSPWTLATYMIEGGSSKTFLNIKKMAYQNPEMLHSLLEKLSDSVTEYLNAQIMAGVDAVMIFDTWGGVLTSLGYQQFSLFYMQKIMNKLLRSHEGQTIPRIIFTKGGSNWLESMAASSCDAIGVDWTLDLAQARARVGHEVALQGNLDPMALLGSPTRLREEVEHVLANFGYGSGHVFNLGHGVDKATPPDNVGFLVDTVHELSRQYHV
ncbi:MAG: uroporphyrinogen decarboxylase [Legionellales bacterium]|nr:uroporphyrinogen decarboxylase [Legionellales bacterium]